MRSAAVSTQTTLASPSSSKTSSCTGKDEVLIECGIVALLAAVAVVEEVALSLLVVDECVVLLRWEDLDSTWVEFWEYCMSGEIQVIIIIMLEMSNTRHGNMSRII